MKSLFAAVIIAGVCLLGVLFFVAELLRVAWNNRWHPIKLLASLSFPVVFRIDWKDESNLAPSIQAVYGPYR